MASAKSTVIHHDFVFPEGYNLDTLAMVLMYIRKCNLQKTCTFTQIDELCKPGKVVYDITHKIPAIMKFINDQPRFYMREVFDISNLDSKQITSEVALDRDRHKKFSLLTKTKYFVRETDGRICAHTIVEVQLGQTFEIPEVLVGPIRKWCGERTEKVRKIEMDTYRSLN